MELVTYPISELADAKRWDFNFFNPSYREMMGRLGHGFPAVKLDDIAMTVTDMGAFSLYNTKFFVDEGIPFLRVQNIQEYGVDLSRDTKFITREYHDRLTKSQLKSGDLLLTTKAVIGVASVVDDDLGECNISQNLVRIVLKAEVNPRYVAVFLNSHSGRLQSETASTGVSQKYLNFKRIRDLKIPLPPREIQDRIAKRMQDAYALQREALQRADALVSDIDALVLQKLGIAIDHLQDRKGFLVSISRLRGSRFDLDLHDARYRGLIDILRSTFGVQLKQLKELSHPITSGSTPLGSDYYESGVPFLRVQNILADGSVNFEKLLYVSESFAKSLQRSAIQNGDLLLVIVGATIGKSAVVKNVNFQVVSNQAMARIRPIDSDDLNSDYLQAFLMSSAGQIQINALKRPVAQGNLNLTETGQIQIPVINESQQKSIVVELLHRRTEAKRFRLEADRIVAEAKAEVERLILGGER